ncbi:putative bifunctional UDP-N-acetylglucosamine transferase and deubiquitinase ALG13 isoform X2 [Leguminivora glycinivorella]|uniref:putative bifunctional UDP-N-acetylglucosamine transferase and deubiquitinase ALG13 isoform X2 n=1 Tax=Leguminivora glycinivorella TaxID=1035111 RepID=UPI0020101F72|nr:putative bifunctional UDP-N-acetylglucosamine transferase and deubiquitinase ALG13 isoform X2 [Leguminivora glycinivorella]
MSPSPIRYRGPWKNHKRSSEPDRWLDEMGFFRKHTARDSSCLFRAVSENIFNTQRYFHKVRLDCVQFMASQRHLFEGSLTCPFENYLKEMSNPSEWGGLIEISAMSHLYGRDFVIFEANKGPQTKICNGYGDTIFLFYSPDTKHFDAVYTKEFINTSSFCQSLVYEILYDGVYQLKDLSYAVDKMLHDKMGTNHIEYFMSENVERRKKKERAKIFIESSNEDDKDRNNNAVALKCMHHTDNLERSSLLKESLSIFVFNRSLIQLENVCMNCLNVNSAKDLLDNGITPFPYKVAKALDPDIYRNIEFDVWSELRRELRYGTRYSDGTTLQVGVYCRCRMQPDQKVAYHCYIQEMRPDGGPCLVFIQELGEKRVVNYEQLEPLSESEARPWAPPYRYSRAHHLPTLSQMLQQIGNITRKQSLTKTRKKPDEPKGPEKAKSPPKLEWKDVPEDQYQTDINLSTYQHLDFANFQPLSVEVEALPLMVDCRPGAAAPHELAHSNGDNHAPVNQAVGDVGAHGLAHAASPPGPRTPAPAPAPAPPMTSYSVVGGGGVPVNAGAAYGYGGCVKSLVWCASPPPPPPPPPPVNPHVVKSVQPNGADLPMNDIPTLRYYFNLGVECMWAAYGAPPPPRHYSPRDLAMDMQQISLQDRAPSQGNNQHEHNKHKPDNNKPPMQGKGNGQRPLLGPRFKRGNQDGSMNNHQNKPHNNNVPNKGPNNRRNSVPEPRAGYEEAGGEPALMPLPYMPYPPPMYPLPYYPVEDPAMLGMMGGMGYVSYEESLPHYYPAPHYPPPLLHPAPPGTHEHHK